MGMVLEDTSEVKNEGTVRKELVTSPLLSNKFDEKLMEKEAVHRQLKSPKGEANLTKNNMMDLINDALDGVEEENDDEDMLKPFK